MSQFIPWPEIKVAFEDLLPTHTPNQAAKLVSQRYPVTRPGVLKKARREAWGKGIVGPASVSALQAARACEIAHDSDYPKATPERMASILEAIKSGSPEYLAAQANGISRTTLAEWKAADLAWNRAIEAAKANRAVHRVNKVEEASDRGDWKATAYLLARDPLTREDFGEQQAKSGIAIQINISRGDEVEVVSEQ